METVANKTANRKSPLSLPIIALVAAIIVSGLLFMFYFPREKVHVVNFSLQAGASVTIAIDGRGSHLLINLSSTGGFMSIKVIVDGQEVYSDPFTSSVAFEYELKRGHHEVSVVVGNPAILGIGRTINVAGTLKIW
ncbi:MAG: hypothetical protein LM588_00530 [Fervidicoccaceae archaeon]|nr:hypothetical protein [Fervidicoccaceae archaeon]